MEKDELDQLRLKYKSKYSELKKSFEDRVGKVEVVEAELSK